MCGRARCTLAPAQVAAASGTTVDACVAMDKYTPRNNVSPGMYTPIQYVDQRTKQVTVRAMKWGLIPSYTGSHEKPNHFMRFNARSEGITETPAYRRLVDTRRCVVHLDGFYEWKKPEKQPYYVYHGASSSSMRMAGIYDTWVDGATGDVLYTYSIVTAEAVGPFAAIHARFPVLLATADEANAWLSSDPFLVVQPLLAARPPTDLLWHAVTKQMGVPTFDGDECIQKLPTPPSITSFFAKSPAKSPTVTAPAIATRTTTTLTTDKTTLIGAERTVVDDDQPFRTFTSAKEALAVIPDNPPSPVIASPTPVTYAAPLGFVERRTGSLFTPPPAKKPKTTSGGILAFLQKDVETNWYDVPAFKQTTPPRRSKSAAKPHPTKKRSSQDRITSFFPH